MQLVNKSRREKKKMCAMLGIRGKRFRYIDKMTRENKRKHLRFHEVTALEMLTMNEAKTKRLVRA